MHGFTVADGQSLLCRDDHALLCADCTHIEMKSIFSRRFHGHCCILAFLIVGLEINVHMDIYEIGV